MMLVRFISEIHFIKWEKMEEAEQVNSLLSMHIMISGIWILICLVWKVAVPHFKYMDEQWTAEKEKAPTTKGILNTIRL